MFDQLQNILDKFTYHFKKVLINAQNIAFAKQASFIEPQDLLESLINTKGALGADILVKQNVNKTAFTTTPHENYQTQNINPSDLPQPSPATQVIIEKAVVAAYKFQHKYVGTEHLLWGLTESEDDLMKSTFKTANIDLKNLRQHLGLVLKSTSKFNELAGDEKIQDLENMLEENLKDHNNALDHFTVNLTSQKIQADIDPVIGRQKEIDRLIEILSRRTKNNPVLLGDAGVGKTAIIEGLAKRILENKVPDVLLNKKILNLDIPSLLAGTMYRGEFESRLKQIINDIKDDPNIILFIDELHTIMGAGATAGSLDAANILKPALARGNLRCIGATTFEEYKKHIESDKALERRFQSIIINESSEVETLEILKGLRKNYEKFHKVEIEDNAIEAAVFLSKRFLPDKKLPDKAIDLIDEASARVKVLNTKNSLAKQIHALDDKINNTQANKKQAILAEDYLAALEYKDQEEKYLDELLKLQAQEDKQQKAKLGKINASHIQQIISEMTGIPALNLTRDDHARLLNLEKKLSEHIFGQDEALNTVANTIRQAKTGLGDKNKPLASFLLLGPSGVGKTETAKRLAQYVFGGTHNMLRLDMSEFAESFNISKLIGAPAGYVGYREGNKLTDVIKNRPYTLLLLDEVEKAHPDVYNLLLPILEEGELTDATGRTVNFRNCIIVMTSNVGLKEFNQQAELGFITEDNTKLTNAWQHISQQIKASLTNYFPPEFMNRLNNIIIFEPLSTQAAKKIITTNLNNLSNTLAKQGVSLNIDKNIINHLLKKAKASQEGARSLQRLVDEDITNLVAKQLLTVKQKNISLHLKENQIVIS